MGLLRVFIVSKKVTLLIISLSRATRKANMETAWNKFIDLMLRGINGTPFDYYLFLLFFFSRLIEMFIAGNIFSIFETYQHEFLLFEKYTYFTIAGYLFLFFLVYIIDQHRLPLNRCTFIALLYLITAVFSTVINMGNNLAYDYFTKLSLMELLTTVVFMFTTASRLNERMFRKLLRNTSKGFIYLILFINIISLAVYIAKPEAQSISVFGCTVELPVIFYDSGTIRQYYRYDGFFRNTSTLGISCSLAISTVIYLFNRKELKPVTAALTVVTGAVLIHLAHSRIGIIATSLSVTIYVGLLIWKNSKHSRIVFNLYCMFFTLAFCYEAYFVFKKIIDLYQHFGGDLFATIDVFTSRRASILAEVWNIYKTHPVIGAGWNVKILKYDSAHNFLLTAAAWTGIVGVILIVCLLVSVVQKGVKERSIQRDPMLFLILFTVFIQCLVEQGILGDARHAHTYLFWLTLGYFAADRNIPVIHTGKAGLH